MPFLSFNFAIFLGLALLLFHLAPARIRPRLLLILSYLYYLTWSPTYTMLLLAVTAGVYATGLWIERSRTEHGKRAWMAIGVMLLLLLLFAFKAAASSLGDFLLPSRSGGSVAALLVVPLGLSYYVFRMVGYLLDVYWELLPAQRSFTLLALYGSFFPQIVSGPIQRAQSFFEQTGKIENPGADDFLLGARRILFGLFKKVAIADPLAILVANVHANPSAFSSLELLMGAYCFSIQLYADFSAITDIAIGIGLLFGVRGPENFDLPYFSPNILAFWRRWHASLTTWLADYLFTPLRMALRRWGNAGLCLAIFINMIAIGLWHGFTATFLAFGVLHGIYVSVSALSLKRRDLFFKNRATFARLRMFAAPLLIFHLVVFSHIFFRAETFHSALAYLSGLIPRWHPAAIPPMRCDASLLGLSAPGLVLCGVAFLVSEVVTWMARQRIWSEWFVTTPILFRRALYCALLVAVLFLYKGSVTFIYAQF
ncbi:MAG: hypothetical protein C5B50_16945 [Verrucomicrobia bacterium]|nr:MAG: hypothetical protein C5B50_16945 [Verrucomicrobiota bacterium]